MRRHADIILAAALLTPAIPRAEAQALTSLVYQEHVYVLLDETDWFTSRAQALALDGDLATINDAEENGAIWDAFGHYLDVPRHLWIGFTDADAEGEWVWADGSPVTFINWTLGSPSNAGGNEHWAVMSPTVFGQWNDNEFDENNNPSGEWNAVVEIPCPCDINEDGAVDVFDFAALSSTFGLPMTPCAGGDVDCDGDVDVFDFSLLASQFGRVCE